MPTAYPAPTTPSGVGLVRRTVLVRQQLHWMASSDLRRYITKILKRRILPYSSDFSSLSIACNFDLNTATDRTTSALQLQTLHDINEPMMDAEGNHVL